MWKNAYNKSGIECWVELFQWWPFWAVFCCSFNIYPRVCKGVSTNHCNRFGSGPYGGALFLATAYNANDSMFPLGFGVMSSENYEDWLWFLEKWKIVVGNKLLLSQIDILLSFVVFLRCLTFKTMPIATVTWRRILVISCPSITHEGTRVKKMHFNS